MFNLNTVKHVYLATGATDLRKAIDGLSAIVQHSFDLSPYEPALFVFCNRKRDKLKILHWDAGFWLYYRRLEQQVFDWPNTDDPVVCTSLAEFQWLLLGHTLRIGAKFKPIPLPYLIDEKA